MAPKAADPNIITKLKIFPNNKKRFPQVKLVNDAHYAEEDAGHIETADYNKFSRILGVGNDNGDCRQQSDENDDNRRQSRKNQNKHP